MNFQNKFETSVKGTNLMDTVKDNENTIQRYINVGNNRQLIYNDLLDRQNSLLMRINYSSIKLWRFKEALYFRTFNGQLIINNKTEIQKEISSRYGPDDVYIVNSLNDPLQNNNQYRINTVFISINNIVVVEEEVFDLYQYSEIFQTYNNGWKRNLLAYTRFNKQRLPNE